MPGDYSRRIFRRNKHYSGVLMQQGRVQLDSDWNEQLDIQLYRTETESIDVIGRCGVPRRNGGFRIGSTPDGRDLTISAGRIYVDGLMCESEAATTYVGQPYLPDPDFTTAVTSPPTSPPGPSRRLSLEDGNYLVYLDTWQQERTALDDQLIREVALGGPDTTARLQTVWQVKLLQVGETSPPSSPPRGRFTCRTPFREFRQLTAPSTGTLNARTAPPNPEEDPCLLPPTSGYSRLENQLYRIEIQTGGTLTQAGGPVTFKWSRDNASVETSVVSIDDEVATVKETGKDELLSFGNNQWVELVNEESTLKAEPRALVQIDQVEPATREITFKSSLASFTNLIPGLKLRRWDQSTDADQNGLAVTPDDWTDIEAGIQVLFAPGTYRAGDYWLIPARTATREIEWPPFDIPNTEPVAQPPRGVRHHFCRLALLDVNDGVLRLRDCRTIFPPLTELLDFFHVGGTGQEAGPGERLPCPLEVGVTNGHLPVVGARVRFTARQGAGTLIAAGASGPSVIVETDEDGVALCAWQLPTTDAGRRCLQVEATLFDDEGQPFAPSLHFNAGIGAAAAAERGITVRQILANSDDNPLINDSLVPVTRLASGITVVCDENIAFNAGGTFPPQSGFPEDRVAAKPTCFVTLDLPYPLGTDVNFWDFNQIVGFQPLILGGQVIVRERNIIWAPTRPATEFLRILMPRLQGRQITDRVLAHLTIKGNFIFARENPRMNLDGEAFGRPVGEDRINLDLPSGDNRRGGDLEMWFWLTPPEVTGPTGLNLSVTVVPAPAGTATNTIRGALRDNLGATVPGAVVTLTGQIGQRTATTDASGAFTFPNLPRGTYRINVQVGTLTADQTVTIT
jgi:Family of unknown function (DUF6519)/Carboxypeptidase regulatory-like domain